MRQSCTSELGKWLSSKYHIRVICLGVPVTRNTQWILLEFEFPKIPVGQKNKVPAWVPQKGGTNGTDRCSLIISTGQLEHSLVPRALYCSQCALEKLGPSFSHCRKRLTKDLIKYKGCLNIEKSSSERDIFGNWRSKFPQYPCILQLQLQAQFKLARSSTATEDSSPVLLSPLAYPSVALILVLAQALEATVLWLKLGNLSKLVYIQISSLMQYTVGVSGERIGKCPQTASSSSCVDFKHIWNTALALGQFFCQQEVKQR